MAKGITIACSTTDGRQFRLSFGAETAVEHVKAAFAAEMAVAPADIGLVHEGNPLEDERTLAHYRLGPEAELHAVPRGRRRGPARAERPLLAVAGSQRMAARVLSTPTADVACSGLASRDATLRDVSGHPLVTTALREGARDALTGAELRSALKDLSTALDVSRLRDEDVARVLGARLWLGNRGLWTRRFQDGRFGLQTEARGEAAGPVRLAERALCQLLETRVQCEHERGPCLDPADPLHGVLQVAPAWPAKPKDERKDGTSMRVPTGGETVTLEAKVDRGCGEHPAWTHPSPEGGRITTPEAKIELDTGAWLEHPRRARFKLDSDKIVEAVDKLRRQNAALAEGDLSRATRDQYFYFDSDTEDMLGEAAKSLGLPPSVLTWLNWMLFDIKGVSWTASSAPRREPLEASACSGRHAYRLDVFPSDRFEASIKFDLTKLPKFDSPWLDFLLGWIGKTDTWADDAGRQVAYDSSTQSVVHVGQKEPPTKGVHVSLGRFRLDFDFNVVLKGSAGWTEWKDHRAYYRSEVSIGLEFGILLAAIAPLEGLLPGPVGLAVKIGNFIGRVITIPLQALQIIESELALLKVNLKLDAEAKGGVEMVFKHMSPEPDGSLLDGGGKLTVELGVSFNAFLLHKSVLGAKAAYDAIDLEMAVTPNKQRGWSDPEIEFEVDWKQRVLLLELTAANRTKKFEAKVGKDRKKKWGFRPLAFLQQKVDEDAR